MKLIKKINLDAIIDISMFLPLIKENGNEKGIISFESNKNIVVNETNEDYKKIKESFKSIGYDVDEENVIFSEFEVQFWPTHMVTPLICWEGIAILAYSTIDQKWYNPNYNNINHSWYEKNPNGAKKVNTIRDLLSYGLEDYKP